MVCVVSLLSMFLISKKLVYCFFSIFFSIIPVKHNAKRLCALTGQINLKINQKLQIKIGTSNLLII